MNTYSQNKEDLFVADYFGKYRGSLLDIGANDGVTFSNSRLLIENGWRATLIEPSSVFEDMKNLYKNNNKVDCYNFGIGNSDRFSIFYESGAHVKGGKDKALVSTTDEHELSRWSDVEFTKKEIRIVSWITFINSTFNNKFDFISIDAESMDWQILKQIDLVSIGCKCLCIEWNGNKQLAALYANYCAAFGMAEALRNAENLIFTV